MTTFAFTIETMATVRWSELIKYSIGDVIVLMCNRLI